jgi:hypothetical protein
MMLFDLAQRHPNRPKRFGFLSQMAGRFVYSELFLLKVYAGQGFLNELNPSQWTSQ